MTNKGATVGLIVLIIVGAGLTYVAWHLTGRAGDMVCEVCNRPVHMETRTVALVGGEREVFCCPTCALSAGRQEGKPVKFLKLTDYATAWPVEPDDAFLVRGSDVNPCLEHEPEMLTDMEKQPSALTFDRCAPSVLAFATRQAAEAFIREHGGELLLAKDLTTGQ